MSAKRGNQVSKTKNEPDARSSDGSGLRVTGSVGLAVALVAGYVGYKYELSMAWRVAWVGLGLAVLCLSLGIVLSLRGRSKDRLGAFLRSEFGSEWNPKTGILSASKIVGGVPRSVTLRYPDGLPDHSQEWRTSLESSIQKRMGTDGIKAKWNQKKSQVRLVGFDVFQSESEIQRQQTIDRCVLIFKPFFRGVKLNLDVTAWEEENDVQPARIELTYGVTPQDGSELWQKKIEAMAGLKLGRRWRAEFDPTADRGFLEPRPQLPTYVPHVGVGVYQNLTERQKKEPMLYYGADENGKARGWQIGRKTTMPHMLCVGPTGGGKTTVLRSLLMGAVAQGIPVFACDPKMIELTPFYGFPGVWVGSTAEEMATMIESIEKLMYERYEKIKKNPKAAESMTPVLFILDELLILRQVLKRHWATPKPDEDGKMKKGTGAPPWFEAISGLLALARSAMINVVIGVQRPDADLFDQGSRDNMRQRLSLMRLSAQGSQMLWGSGFVGVDLPMVQGRAMASPDGETPVEIQTFWVADPVTAEGADREVVEGFRKLATELFENYEPPIDVGPFEGSAPAIETAELRAVSESFAEKEPEPDDQPSSLFEDATFDDVNADSLVEGDTIILENGNQATVLEVGEDPFDENAFSVTLQSDSGTEEVSFDSSERVSRVLDVLVA